MKAWTISDILNLNPCEGYSQERLEELANGRTKMTSLEVIDLDIPAEHRIWLLCREGREVVDVALARIADRAVRSHCLGCGWEEAEKWAEAWLSGVDRSAKSAWPLASINGLTPTDEAAACAAGAAWGSVADWRRIGREVAQSSVDCAAMAWNWSDEELTRQLADFRAAIIAEVKL
jgi:hypothetical protein